MSRYIQKADCETIVLDEETMILSPESLTVTKVSPVGGFCWTQLNQEQTLASLTDAVCRHYAGADSGVSGDIEQFLTDLLECGLIEARE